MSIHAISGKPGGGKTMYSVKLILHELLYGNRVIITNVGLLPGEINAYLQREYPSKSINLFERLILIDEEQMGVFFTIRPPGSRGAVMLTKEQWQQGKMPDYTGVTDRGVMYVLDEIHIKFNARAWMQTGQDVLYYLSQHRKLGDTVIWITQAINNVDKQFRSVTQDYTFIRNLAKERMSKFHLPSIFINQTYTSPPTDNSKPMESGSFRMDVKGLAALYDTAKGVGIHGMAGADKNEKKKGLPWWVAIAGLLLIVILGFKFIPGLVARMFTPPKKVAFSVLPQKTNEPSIFQSPLNEVKNMMHTETVKPANHENVATWQQTNEVLYATGYDKLLGSYQIYLSDGRVLTADDPKLQQINPRVGVKYDGRLIPFRKPEPALQYVPQSQPQFDFDQEYMPPRRYKVAKQ